MLNKITHWFARFLELQLVISLISLPLLMHWGLAISYMSPFANLLFTPLLALFLWCSCLLSLFSIVHLPCSWIATVLYYVEATWHYLLSYATPSWLIGFPLSMIGYTIMISLLVFALYTFIKPRTYIAVCILLTFTAFLLIARNTTQYNTFEQIGTLPLHLLRANHKTYLIDSGALCKKQNFYSWIDYTLLPTLVKQTGTTTIDSLFLYKPSKRLAKIAAQFTQQTNTQHIFITTKQGCYHELKNLLDESIKIHPIKKSTLK